jgi:prepilin-type N-terminal cleavage/methylation domain-containing protein
MKRERGYTLVEAIVALAITGIIMTVIGLVVQQMVTVPERGDAQLGAIHPMQNAAHWLELDGQMASSAVGGSNLTLTFPSTVVIRYVRSGTKLLRCHGSDNMTLASNVLSANFTVLNRVIYMTLVTKPDSRWNISENYTYRAYMRSTI